MVYPVDMAVDDKGVKHGLTNYGDHAAKEEIMGSDKCEETRNLTDQSVSSKRSRRGNYVNDGQEDQMEIYGYRLNHLKNALSWYFIVQTVGILQLIFYWRPSWQLRCTHDLCSLVVAEKVLLKDQYDEWYVEDVKVIDKEGRKVSDKRADDAIDIHYKPTDPDDPVLVDVAHKKLGEEHPLLKGQFFTKYFEDSHRFFYNKKVKYMWIVAEGNFQKLRIPPDLPCSFFHVTKGLSASEQQRRLVIYGDNSFKLHVTSVAKLLLTQALHPFYIFQIFSCILWFTDTYYYYASTIIIISAVSLMLQVRETRKNQRAVKKTVKSHGMVNVCRDSGVYEEISSAMLVPGDIIEVPRHGCTMYCDAVLVTGNCIVDESMLTGESVPVTKVPLPNPQLGTPSDLGVTFNLKEHGRHVLFCGTKIVQTRYYSDERVRAVVLRTGFMTAKGELVRSILFPKPVRFKFTQDSFKWIGVLSLISLVGMAYTLSLLVKNQAELWWILRRTLDLVTIVIPPALPAAMTIGIVFAQKRLKQQQIFCINSPLINVCGVINVFCFDKTGTLTEDGLDLCGVIPIHDNRFLEIEPDVSRLGRQPVMIAMATCHSLTRMDGVLAGDPLDLRMFDTTGWELEEPGEDTSRFDVFLPTVVRPKKPDVVSSAESFDAQELLPFEVGIVRQFTFSSHLQRMSVVARTLSSSHFDLYAKGSPEMIAQLSRPETVPTNFPEILLQYTQQGYRVIALAHRPLHKFNYVKIQRAERDMLERDLTFLGLLVMENRLKPQSAAVIAQLKNANIRTVMVTGDNMLTALSVARDCGMVEPHAKVVVAHVTPGTGDKPARVEWKYADSLKHPSSELQEVSFAGAGDSEPFYLAITGHSWSLLRSHLPHLLPKLAVKGVVFARMSPDQKQQLVETLQSLGYYVGMCGDGANDCGALKTAHTGISLSDAEASVASPFTSKEHNVTCVPTVIREGRAALVTSFGIFKYMAMYSLTQFATVCILYWVRANLTDPQFMYADLFLITSLSITFGYTQAYHELWPTPPPTSLVALTPILSLIMQVCVMAVALVVVNQMTISQPWYAPFVPNEEDLRDYSTSYEVTTVFGVSMFIYISSAVVFAKGTPYRKAIHTNYYFLINVLVCYAVSFFITVYPLGFVSELMDTQPVPSTKFLYLIVGIGCIHLLTSVILEVYVVDGWMLAKLQRCLARTLMRAGSRAQYEHVEDEMEASSDWPPQSQSSHSLSELLWRETNNASIILSSSSSSDDVAVANGTSCTILNENGIDSNARHDRGDGWSKKKSGRQRKRTVSSTSQDNADESVRNVNTVSASDMGSEIPVVSVVSAELTNRDDVPLV